jgi:hypothetical protein
MINLERCKLDIVNNTRGFSCGLFTDYYDQKCSLQKSSLANVDCIWLGVDDPEPKIMASVAERFGLITDETTGWIPYPIPKDVHLSTRMHLNREQVRDLLPLLQKFVDTGEL